LEDEGIAFDLVPFPGESRTCTIVLARDGQATVVNEPGPEVSDPSALLRAFDSQLPRSRAVALMGSLPPGAPPELYAMMISRARERGVFSLLDTSGEALRLGLAAGPTFAKPNRVEAEALLGRELGSALSRREAVESLRDLGAANALITFGGDGFLIATGEGVHRCLSPTGAGVRLGNPTGAGDALAAGLLAGTLRGYPVVEMVRLAAAAAAASLSEGYGRFRPKDVRVEAFPVERLG
jgi:1-phosphofructokinase family hexose kinase